MGRKDAVRWALACAAVGAFAAYISLVPFTRRDVPPGVSIGDVLQSLTFEVRSLTNVFANALMFVPFGLCGVAALTTRPSGRRGPWWLSVVIILWVSLALSLAIESLQFFVPRRTPSWTDVVAQAFGTIVGIGLWTYWSRQRQFNREEAASGALPGLDAWLWAYTGLLLVVMAVDPSVAGRRREPLATLMSGVLLALPVGVLASRTRLFFGDAGSASRSAIAGTTFLVIAEAIRLLVQGRFDLRPIDVVPSVIGVVAGLLLARRAWGTDQGSADLSMPAAIFGLAAAVVAYAVYNLTPFDFDVSHAGAAERMDFLTAAPFRSYYQNQEFKAVRDLLVKVGFALPIGVCLQLVAGIGRGGVARARSGIWLVLAGAYFLSIEVTQALLPSRYPDNTDVMLGVFGVWVGMRVGRMFVFPSARPPVDLLNANDHRA